MIPQDMKKRVLVFLSALFISSLLVTNAQTSLAGRSYHHPNIMADAMKDATKDLDKKIAEARKKAIAEGEKKKGRKLTAAETAEVDKQLKEGKEKAATVMKAMKTSVSIEFKTATQAVMRLSMKIDDEALKAAGVGWVKRKALKAALALAPESSKEPYVVKGNSVIIGKGKDQETFTLSADGKYLTGKADDKNVTLTRIQ